eukprot:TRINITY_DN92571_c0_g1_i1.p1 TRINITY_DN92571_c0_g1~~TRINITY_DN92571_c0_g1_i1.p1  ORF type:complete len:211 (-),score=47.97 TRINITY_DN92571_c0_g1_i1:85-717(-)
MPGSSPLDLLDALDVFCIRTSEDDVADFSPKLAAMLEGQCMEWDRLPPETDTGCIEYKWRLGREHDSARRIARLATQMRFRLAEGSGVAYYLLGVRDSGVAEGLAAREHSDAVSVLMAAAALADSMLLLEALSPSRGGCRRCSVWRLEQRHSAVIRLAKELHLSDSLPKQARCYQEVDLGYPDTNDLGIAPLARAQTWTEHAAVPVCVKA